MSRAMLYCGDVLDVLPKLADESVQCCVTSPPYWGLRDYGVAGQLGLEPTPEEYVERMVAVFREVRRVLRKDGTLWLNLGDCYANPDKGGYAKDRVAATDSMQRSNLGANFIGAPNREWDGVPPKNLVGIPWRVAFALQADGWWLRSDIIWAKPNPMPESVTDRPTRAHEYVFLLSKAARYYYDAAAIAELSLSLPRNRGRGNGESAVDTNLRGKDTCCGVKKQDGHGPRHAGFNARYDFDNPAADRNARTVWGIATQPYPEAHFATFPEELARRCILAGSRPGDTVLDPFGGSGTVAQVATGNGRASIYIDLNPEYLHLAEQRIGPMLCERAA